MATALTALAGVGSAMAAETTLCKSNAENPYCYSTYQYAGGTAVEASSSSVTFDFEGANHSVTCTGSTIAGKTKFATGEPLELSISSWSLTGCTMKVIYNLKCTVTPVSGSPYSATLSKTSGLNGTLAVTGAGWNFKCGGGSINCTYQPTSSLEVTGGAPAKITAKVPLNRAHESGETGCFEDGELTMNAVYGFSPTPAYVATALPPPSPLTRLCKVLKGECPESQTYPAGTEIAAEAPSMTIETASTITCGETKLSGETTAMVAEPLPLGNVSFTTTGCKSSSYLGSCSIQQENVGSPPASISNSTPIESLFELNVKLRMTCAGGLVTCVLSEKWQGTLYNGSEGGTIKFYEAMFKANQCQAGEVFRVTANFKVTTPNPLYAI